MRNVRFSRDGWKVMLVTVTVAMVKITGMFALGVREPKVAKAEVDETEVEALVKKAALILTLQFHMIKHFHLAQQLLN